MAENDWNEEIEPRPRKAGLPRWALWGCGGGCLLLVLVLAGVSLAGWLWVREARDPEKQWPALAEVLAFDERPTNLTLEFGFDIGVRQFHLVDAEQHIYATLTEFPSASAAQTQMDPDGPTRFQRPVDPVAGTLEVQGREVPCLRFERVELEPEAAKLGPGIRLDLGGTGKPRILDLRRQVGSDPIEPQEVTTFLAPFDVWRGH